MHVGVTPYTHDGDITRPYVPDGYKIGVESRGGELVVLYYTETNEALIRRLHTLDAIIFAGGPDVAPERYGRAREEKLGQVVERRDEVELLLLDEAMKTDMPILAICRGIQLVNVGLGGTLIQDLPSYNGENHHQGGAPLYGHDVTIASGTRLSRLAGVERAPVNTYHHQAIDDLAPSLVVSARNESGVIEAVERPASRYFMAYQWHPEVMLGRDALSEMIFDDFMGTLKNP